MNQAYGMLNGAPVPGRLPGGCLDDQLIARLANSHVIEGIELHCRGRFCR